MTSDGIKEHLTRNGNPELNHIYGVKQKYITHTDPFHNCNLACVHATEKGFGKTENGNNRQVHHRQAMQTLHDIVASDKEFAQHIADGILKGHGLNYVLRTWRERVQRWLVNGRNAEYILKRLNIDISNAQKNFWVLWATAYLPYAEG